MKYLIPLILLLLCGCMIKPMAYYKTQPGQMIRDSAGDEVLAYADSTVSISLYIPEQNLGGYFTYAVLGIYPRNGAVINIRNMNLELLHPGTQTVIAAYETTLFTPRATYFDLELSALPDSSRYIKHPKEYFELWRTYKSSQVFSHHKLTIHITADIVVNGKPLSFDRTYGIKKAFECVVLWLIPGV